MNRQQKRKHINPLLPLPMQYPSKKRIIDRKKANANSTAKGHIFIRRSRGN